MFFEMLLQIAGVEPSRVVDAARFVADGDHARAAFVHRPGSPAANIAEPLDGDGHPVQAAPAALFEQRTGDVGDAQPGRLFASMGAADLDRFSGDDRRDRVATMHGVGVHDPGHHLGVGPDIGRWDVAFRPDEGADLGGVAAGHFFKLARAQRSRVDDDPPFGAAVGQVHQGTFPGHPHRQGTTFVQRDAGMVAQPPLGRPFGHVVVDPKTRKDANVPVIHLYRKMDDQLALAAAQRAVDSFIQMHEGCNPIQLPQRHLIRAGLFNVRFGVTRGGFAVGTGHGGQHRNVCMGSGHGHNAFLALNGGHSALQRWPEGRLAVHYLLLILSDPRRFVKPSL